MSRVLVDTNVILSALLFPRSVPAQVVNHVILREQLVVTEWIIDELYEVTLRKRPDLIPSLDQFFLSVDYELAAQMPFSGARVLMADPKDQPILDAAIAADVEILISGDKHFLELRIDRPKVMNARDYVDSQVREE